MLISRATRLTMLAVACLSISTLASAQTSLHDHNSVSVPVIDGSKNPKLIPDLVAYRLYLVTVGELPMATVEDQARQQAHIAQAGLGKDDGAVLLKIANDFKQQYRSLIDDYNAHLNPQFFDSVALRSFLLKRDALVASAMASLKHNLIHPLTSAPSDRDGRQCSRTFHRGQ